MRKKVEHIVSDVVIVDYGAGNLRSVVRAVTRAGVEPLVTSDPGALTAARAVIVPGVGAAADTMHNLNSRGLAGPLRDYVASNRPFLGVCMGMQALFDLSEEGGEHPCLGILPGRVVRFQPGLTVPHMGWNTVRFVRRHPVCEGIRQDSYFYFVHSYHAAPADASVIVGETEYGRIFPAMVGRGNLLATQFHPEKSGADGLRLYENFLRLARDRGTIAPSEETTEEVAAR